MILVVVDVVLAIDGGLTNLVLFCLVLSCLLLEGGISSASHCIEFFRIELLRSAVKYSLQLKKNVFSPPCKRMGGGEAVWNYVKLCQGGMFLTTYEYLY